MKLVIYTSIFGGYDGLQNPPNIKNVDYVCFTDHNVTSNFWKIIECPIKYQSPNLCAKEYKILPHKHFKEYDYSIWVDGNISIIGNIQELIECYLIDHDIAFFNHQNTIGDSRNCIYSEAKAVSRLKKDNPNIVHKQISKYKKEGYPKNNGLICGGIIVRKHSSPKIIESMEDWWKEIKSYSKRDQLSFNYIAWKNKLKYNFIQGDIRNNKYFKLSKPHKPKK